MVNLDFQQQSPDQPIPVSGEGVWDRTEERRQGRLRHQPPGPSLKEMASASLILIGTVHGDPRGYARVLGLLERFRPEVVTVEISRFSLRYRGIWEARWRRQLQKTLAALPPEAQGHPALQMVAAQIALPFEYRAARDYCRQNGAKCLPLDLGGLSRRHLPRYGRELLSPDNLRALSAEPRESLEEAVAREFRRARAALARPPWRLAQAESPETRRREIFVGRRLKRLTAKHGRVVHLGGWEHLVPWLEGGGLLSLLAEQQPYILLADEGDSLSRQEDPDD